MADSQDSEEVAQHNYAEQIVNAVSHDLKNPTRQIKSFLQILQSHSASDIDEKGRHYLDLVLQAADTLQTKLDALTLLSRASTSKLEIGPCDSTAAVEDALSTLSQRIEASGTVIDADVSAKVSADSKHLVAVLVELIGNSLKFCDQPGTITIKTDVTDGECVFSVSDSGPGFDAQDFTAPFDLFRRFHTAEFEGTGTGLTVVRTVLARQNSTPKIESSPDSGTTVRFALPLA